MRAPPSGQQARAAGSACLPAERALCCSRMSGPARQQEASKGWGWWPWPFRSLATGLALATPGGRAAASPHAAQKRHLLVMQHGLFGNRANWRVIARLLEQHTDPETTLLWVATSNEYSKARARGGCCLAWRGWWARVGAGCAWMLPVPVQCQCSQQQQLLLVLPRPSPHARLLTPKCYAAHPPRPRARTHLLCNHQTFDGVDVCGERLAEEIRGVVAAHPGLERISLLGHSMGGLMS